MKYLKYALVLALMVGAFIAGQAVRIGGEPPKLDSDREERTTLPQLTIDSIRPDYESYVRPDDPPSGLTIKLYVRNQTADRARGRYSFALAVNDKGISSRFLSEWWSALAPGASAADERKFLKYFKEGKFPASADPRLKALASLLERGKKLPEGFDYEPTGLPGEVVYTATLYADVDLEPGAAGVVELEAIIPPEYRGFIFELTSSAP